MEGVRGKGGGGGGGGTRVCDFFTKNPNLKYFFKGVGSGGAWWREVGLCVRVCGGGLE